MKYKRKTVEIKVAGRNKVIIKKYKIDVPRVDGITEAMKEFGGMVGVIDALNLLLEGRATGTFKISMRNFGNVKNAKRAARNARVMYIKPSVSIKRKVDLYEKIKGIDLSNMSQEDIANAVRKVLE